MKIINEPRYKDFNGKVHRTEQECIRAEKAFADKVFEILDELIKGCEDHGTACKDCPFFNNSYGICYIEKKTGDIPNNWHLEKEE